MDRIISILLLMEAGIAKAIERRELAVQGKALDNMVKTMMGEDTQDLLQAPYEMSKNFAAVNCVTPPGLAKTAKGKLATAMGKKYGYPDSEIVQANWSLGWTEGAVIVQGLKNAKGSYTGTTVKAGLEKVKTLDVGGLAPNVGFSPKCHMLIRQLRPYTYNYKTKSLQPIGSYTQWAKFNTNAYAAPGTCGKK